MAQDRRQLLLRRELDDERDALHCVAGPLRRRQQRDPQSTYKGANSVTCAQAISLWDWTSGVWVDIDSRSVGTTEVLVDKSVSGTLADYVSGTSGDGELRVRVRCTNASYSFFARGDLMRLTHTRA